MNEADAARAEAPPEGRAKPSTARRVVTLVFYGLVLALLGAYLARIDFGALLQVRPSWGWFALALAVGLGQRMLIPLVWVLIVRDLGVVIRNYPAYNFVYAKAWLGRYVPGKVAMVAARVYFAEELGASRSVIAVSSIAEIGAQLLVTAAVGLLGVASVAESVEVIAPYRPIAYGMVAVLALLLWPPVFNGAMRVAFRLLRRPVAGQPRVGASTLAWAVAGFAVVSAATGALAVLLAAAVDASAFDHALFVWGTYSLAGALGMAFVLAPSGLGAREAVQLPLFGLVFSPEAAVAIVILSRLAEVAIDALFYGTGVAWERWARSR